MRRIALISLTLVLALASTASYAARNNGGGGTSIPPNCLIDPWTKEMVCVKW